MAELRTCINLKPNLCYQVLFSYHVPFIQIFLKAWSHVSMAYFRLSTLQKHVRKVVGGFGKKSCVSTGVTKLGNAYVSPTAMI